MCLEVFLDVSGPGLEVVFRCVYEPFEGRFVAALWCCCFGAKVIWIGSKSIVWVRLMIVRPGRFGVGVGVVRG